MVVNKEIINDYKDHGVALLRNFISSDWLKKLAKGIEKNIPKFYLKEFLIMDTAVKHILLIK